MACHEGSQARRGCVEEKYITPNTDAFDQAKFIVLQHTTEVEPYIEEHMEMLRQRNLHQSKLG
jgi:hypothetical protein